MKLDTSFIEGAGGQQAKGQGGREQELLAIEEERQVTGVGEGYIAVGFETEDYAGGEASLHSSCETLVESAENFAGARGLRDLRADDAHNGCDIHGGFEPFTAYVSQSDDRGAVRVGEDLEEVAADLLGGSVGAGDCIACQ